MRHLARVAMVAGLSVAGLCFAGEAPQSTWRGSWAASIGSGGTTAFAGTWSAVPGKTADVVAGSWSLRDQTGAELATGTWAAAKEGKIWKGSWQARRASGQVYNGSWQAQVELPATSQFSELFEAAIAKAVSGSWGMGSQVGAGGWTIRAYAQ
jgi:hypothetical protein